MLFRFLTGSSIVALHGMGAHPVDTWRQKIGGDEDSASVNWLEDERFIPATLPCARGMRYGYHSRWFGKEATKTKASDISQSFLLELMGLRKVGLYQYI